MNIFDSAMRDMSLQKIAMALDFVKKTKWKNARVEHLAIQKKLMDERSAGIDLIAAANVFVRRNTQTTYAQQQPIRALARAFESAAAKNAEVEMKKFYAAYPDALPSNHCAALLAVPPAFKRSVLRAMPIVSVPVSAAYLGVPDKELHDFARDHTGLLGGVYQGGFCYSIDELILIAQNRAWIPSTKQLPPLVSDQMPDDLILDHLIFVSEAVACSFVDMHPYELRKKVTKSTRKRRPYRLSDLEKIRAAMQA